MRRISRRTQILNLNYNQIFIIHKENEGGFKENAYVSKERGEECRKINKTNQDLINQTTPSGTNDLI